MITSKNSHSFDAGVPADIRHFGVWSQPLHPGGNRCDAPYINCKVCARGVFRSQAARSLHQSDAVWHDIPPFQPVRAKTKENGAYYGSRPVGNTGISMSFRATDRQTGIVYRFLTKRVIPLTSIDIITHTHSAGDIVGITSNKVPQDSLATLLAPSL